SRMLAPEPRARPAALEVATELTRLLESLKPVTDPFAQLVAQGVSVHAADPDAIPTSRIYIPLAEPDSMAVGPTAPSPRPTPVVAPPQMPPVAGKRRNQPLPPILDPLAVAFAPRVSAPPAAPRP